MEHEQIQAALSLMQDKVDWTNSSIKACLETERKNSNVTEQSLLKECVGEHYQIVLWNYKANMNMVKEVFMEIIRFKLIDLDEEYDDEVNFFMDLLSDFIDKDFLLKESLEIAKESAKYYVSPHFFDSLLEICDPEI